MNALTRQQINELRSDIQERLGTDAPIFTCLECSTPLTLRSSTRHRFFFRHTLEDGRCSAITKGKLSQADIRALAYGRRDESPRHIALKEHIRRSLEADPTFSRIVVEQRLKGTDPKTWRKPDIRAQLGDQIFAFEAQVNPTFLDVIIERGQFYRREGIVLSWILPDFSPHDRQLYEDDILQNNRGTILVVDEQTVAKSEAAGQFLVKCWKARLDKNSTTWAEEIVPFSDLEFDVERQQVYAPFDTTPEGLKAQLEALLGEAHEPRASDPVQAWAQIRAGFAQFGIRLDGDYGETRTFRSMFLALMSLELGRPYRLKFKKLIEVAHNIRSGTRALFPAFIACAAELGQLDEILREEDKTGKLAALIEKERKAWSQNAAQFAVSDSELKAMILTFPRAAPALRRFIRVPSATS